MRADQEYKRRIEAEIAKHALAVSIEWEPSLPSFSTDLGTVVVRSSLGGALARVSILDAVNPRFAPMIAEWLVAKIREIAREKQIFVSELPTDPIDFAFAVGKPIHPDNFPPMRSIGIQEVSFVAPIQLQEGDVILTNAYTGQPLSIERNGTRIWQEGLPF